MTLQKRVERLEGQEPEGGLLIARVYSGGPLICEGQEMTQAEFEAEAKRQGRRPLIVCYVDDWRGQDDAKARG